MATVTHLGSTWNTTAGAKTVTATPAVGDLIVVVCGNSNRTVAQVPTITCNVQGITFVNTGACYTRNTSAHAGWIFVSASFCTVASSTVFTMTPVATDTGGGLTVFAVSGMSRSGLNAFRQWAKRDNSAAGTPSVTMPGACLTGNPVFGSVGNVTNSTTTTAPPTGWSESFDNGYATPTTGQEVCFRASGETLTTLAWTAASASAYGCMAAEFDASVPASGPLLDPHDARFQPILAQ